MKEQGYLLFAMYDSQQLSCLILACVRHFMIELTAPLKIYPQVLENIRVTDKKVAQNDPAVQKAVSRVAEALGDTGRILVRESGTEPVVRVMVEAPAMIPARSMLMKWST